MPVALRVLVVVTFPLLTVGLAKSLGYYASLPDIPVPALAALGVSGPTVIIVALTGALAVVAALSKRSPTLAFGVATGIILWLGFPFSQLRWYRFVPGLDRLAHLDVVAPAAWLAGAALLAVASALALGDAAVGTRRALAANGVPDAVARAASARVGRGGARALAAGVAGASALALLVLALVPALRGGLAGAPRVNPVVTLLALGALLALGLNGLLRPRDVASGVVRPLFAARASRSSWDDGRRGTDDGRRGPTDDGPRGPARRGAFGDYVDGELARERERGP